MRVHGRDIAVCLILTLGYAAGAWWRGQDANWDLQNYHAYAVHALFHAGAAGDVAPGDWQGFLNPLPYVPVIMARRWLGDEMAAPLVGALQSLGAWVCWGLSRALVPGGFWLRVAATVLAAGGAAALSELGTSFADLLLAAPILAGLWLVVRAPPSPRDCLMGGLLCGGAIGMKLTGAVFAPGLVLAVLTWGWVWWRIGLLAVGGIAGGAATAGWWAWRMWREHANPIFPGFNTWFRSPDAIADNFTDPERLPKGVMDAVLAPWRWATGDHPWVDLSMRDARFLLALSLSLGVVFAWLLGRRPSRPLLAVSCFLLVSDALWQTGFGIIRYAVALEMLGGVLIVAIVSHLAPRAAVVAVAVAVAVWTRPGDFWHRPWPTAYHGPVLPAALRQPAAFLMTGTPMGYLVPYFPEAARFYRLEPKLLPEGSRLRTRFVAGIAAPPVGGLWLLTPEQPLPDDTRAMLTGFGLAFGRDCLRFESLWFVDTLACRLRSGTGAPSVAAGDQIDFARPASGWAFQGHGWWMADPDGTWAVGPEAVLRLTAAPGLSMRLRLRGFDRPGGTRVGVRVNDSLVGDWVFNPGDGWAERRVCLPEGGVEVAFQAPEAASPLELGQGPEGRRLVLELASAVLGVDPGCEDAK